MCNGVVVKRDQCFKALADIPPEKDPLSQPLSVLINFNAEPLDQQVNSNESFSDDPCGETQIFDPISGICQTLACSSRRILTNEECQPLYRNSRGFSMISFLSQPLNDTASLESLLNTYERAVLQALKQMGSFLVTASFLTSYGRMLENMSFRYEILAVNITMNLVSEADATIRIVEQRIRDLKEIIYIQNTNMSFTSLFTMCPQNENSLIEGKAIPFASFGKLSVPHFSNCLGPGCLDGVKYLPVYGILDCPHVTINTSEHNITYNPENTTLSVFGQNILLNESSHYFCGETLKICAGVVYDIQEIWRSLNDSNNDSIPPPISTSDLAMTILSIVCIALSLTCLFLTFIVYCVLRSLRTLPGKNTMALIFHLFCAQLIFQVGIQLNFNGTLCRVVGVLIHYLWLTAFAWMAISAYHMASVFSNMTANNIIVKTGEWKRLIRYAIIVYAFALVFALSCVITHLVRSKCLEIGYGNDICFINRPMDIGIFFALPLGLILTFNVICFIRTVFSIKMAPNIGNSKNTSNRNHAHVYFRLSILLGFTWIFGFVAAVFRTNALWYIFIVLNGLQGVFIFVAYCLNKRTIGLLKTRFKLGEDDKLPSSQNSPKNSTNSTEL